MSRPHIADVPLSDLIAARDFADNQYKMWYEVVNNYRSAVKGAVSKEELAEAEKKEQTFRYQTADFKRKIDEKYNWMVENVL